MYRLDFIDGAGNITGAVTELGSDWLGRHAQTARRIGSANAEASGSDVLVTRIGQHGATKATLTIHPDGTTSPPPQAHHANPREVCRASRGPCFCTPCRRDREDARTAQLWAQDAKP